MRGRGRIAVMSLVLSAGLIAPAPSPAMTGCTSQKVVTASVAAPTTNPAGNYPSCVPDLSCQNAGGCWITLRGSVTGAGLVSLEMLAEGIEPVACGPALRGCEVVSPMFFVPFGSARALCQTKIAVAVAARVTCTPVFA